MGSLGALNLPRHASFDDGVGDFPQPSSECHCEGTVALIG